MPTKYANDTALKIIDIVDDFVEIPLDGRIAKLTEKIADFIDGESLEQADVKIDPKEAYLSKARMVSLQRD